MFNSEYARGKIEQDADGFFVLWSRDGLDLSKAGLSSQLYSAIVAVRFELHECSPEISQGYLNCLIEKGTEVEVIARGEMGKRIVDIIRIPTS